jgi:WD40 repeat protein
VPSAALDIPFQWVGYIRFSQTSQFLLAWSTANDFSTDLKVWETNNWAEIPAGRIHDSDLLHADLSPDGSLLAVAYADGRVQLSRLPSGDSLTSFTNRARLVAVRFSPDGRFLALGLGDGTVVLWDVANRPEFATLPGHFLDTWSAAFSSDGRRLLTGGRNPRDAVKLWDVVTQSELLVLPAEGRSWDVGFSPDGNTLVANSPGGVAHFWRAPSWAEIDAAEKAETVRPE